MKEDVTEIILNIKGLTAKLYCDEPKTVRIEAQGECEVTAGSIECDSEVEILDPSMHIATLDAGAKLSMEITLRKGQGYVSADRNKHTELEKAPIGTIAVDSIYTPVLKVNYTLFRQLNARTDKSSSSMVISRSLSLPVSSFLSMISVALTSSERSTSKDEE